MADRKPTILVTAGDPNGIGPEIALKAAARESVRRLCMPRIVGQTDVLAEAAKSCGLRIDKDDLVPAGGAIRNELVPGMVQAEAGRLAYEALCEAHALLAANKANALVTAPWNKAALHSAGCPQIGHTEALAALAGCADPVTLFVCGRLRIAFLTRHLPLADAVKAVSKERVLSFLRRLQRELPRIGLASPRLAVAALNPHAGEGGLLGREEIDEIGPAVEAARAEGIDVEGPVPADAVFHRAAEGAHDCVISLFHDQGHIAAKTLDFFGTVSLTLGLPYIRTSPDHGTAFDIAWKNRADPASLIHAIELAARLAGD
jgi:4-hydroxythreonine-4-phosphate dehydrogenase